MRINLTKIRVLIRVKPETKSIIAFRKTCLNYYTYIYNSQKELAYDIGYDSTLVNDPGPKSLEVRSKIQQDYLKAEIYYQTLNVQSITQTAKISVIKFLVRIFCMIKLFQE